MKLRICLILTPLVMLAAALPARAQSGDSIDYTPSEVELMTKRYTDSGILLEFTVQERQDGSFGIENVGVVPIYCWKQDSNIQAISSLKYLDEPPEGMSSGTYQRMQDSYHELEKLLGEGVKMLAE